MPYSRKAKYRHFRRKDPKDFYPDSFRTVKISHTDYRGKKWNKEGVKAVVGKEKKSGDWKIQAILVPKKYFKKSK